jgi:exodeoxyribonuclease VII small subunit
MPEPAKKPSFEGRLDELNALIKQLEKGDLGLEDAIATFERGRALHHDLAAQLQDFERRIEVLTRGADGQDRLEPARGFDPARKNEPAPPF